HPTFSPSSGFAFCVADCAAETCPVPLRVGFAISDTFGSRRQGLVMAGSLLWPCTESNQTSSMAQRSQTKSPDRSALPAYTL
ncbi:hypothetical protein BCR44DRAFT_1435458, partial [Catenaria anguillulae PL171]